MSLTWKPDEGLVNKAFLHGEMLNTEESKKSPIAVILESYTAFLRRRLISVIGAAANEATRIESLTKTVGHQALASKAFVDLCPDDWTSVGLHPLRGVGQ